MNQRKVTKKSNINFQEDIKKLQIELDRTRKEKDDYKNKYLRALADYQNFEKRVGEEKEALRQSASRELLLKLLPFLDDIEKAEVFIKDSGLKLVKDKFIQIIREENIEELQILGKEFDPHLAEAVDVVKGENDNIIIEVSRKGYTLNGKVLRVAQVKVSKKITNSNQQEANKL